MFLNFSVSFVEGKGEPQRRFSWAVPIVRIFFSFRYFIKAGGVKNCLVSALALIDTNLKREAWCCTKSWYTKRESLICGQFARMVSLIWNHLFVNGKVLLFQKHSVELFIQMFDLGHLVSSVEMFVIWQMESGFDVFDSCPGHLIRDSVGTYVIVLRSTFFVVAAHFSLFEAQLQRIYRVSLRSDWRVCFFWVLDEKFASRRTKKIVRIWVLKFRGFVS